MGACARARACVLPVYKCREERLPPHTCSAIMDLKVVFLIVFLSALAITSTDAIIPKCCIGVKEKLPRHLLWKVERCEKQHSNGACDIEALVVYLKGYVKPMCLAPRLEKYLKRRKEPCRN